MDYTNLPMMKEKNQEMLEKLTKFLSKDGENLTEEQTQQIENYKNYMDSIIKEIEEDFNSMVAGDKSEELRARFNENYFKIKKPLDLINSTTNENTEENLKKIESFLNTTQMYIRINEVEEKITKFTTYEELKKDINRGSFFPFNDEQLMAAFTSEFESMKIVMADDAKSLERVTNLEARLKTMYQVHTNAPVTEKIDEKIKVVLPESTNIYEILDLPTSCSSEELKNAYSNLLNEYIQMINNPDKYENTSLLPDFITGVLRPGYIKAMKDKGARAQSDAPVETSTDDQNIDDIVQEISDNVQQQIEEDELNREKENEPVGLVPVTNPENENEPVGLVPVTNPENENEPVGLVPVTNPENENEPVGLVPVTNPENENEPVGLVPVTNPENENEPVGLVPVTNPEKKDDLIKPIDDKKIIIKQKNVNKWKKAIIFASGAIIAGTANIATANASAPVINLLAYAGLGSGIIAKIVKKFKKNKAVKVEEPTPEQIEKAKTTLGKIENYFKSDEFIEDMMTFSSGMLLGSKLTSIASNLVGTNTITPDVTTATPDVPTDVAGVTPDIPDITPDMSDVALDVTPDVDVFGYDDIVVGQGIEGADITTGYTNSINAVSGLDQVTLNTDIINDGNSIIERFVVVDDAGSILDSINTDGLSVQDLIDKGINPDNIAVDIRNATGDPRAWVSLDEMGIGRTL